MGTTCINLCTLQCESPVKTVKSKNTSFSMSSHHFRYEHDRRQPEYVLVRHLPDLLGPLGPDDGLGQHQRGQGQLARAEGRAVAAAVVVVIFFVLKERNINRFIRLN